MEPHARGLLARAIATACGAAFAVGSAGAADAERGRALYELRCAECHGQGVHERRSRAATDFESLRRWVALWSEHLRLGWSGEEIDDVAAYLNDTHYRFPCEPRACKTGAAAPSMALRIMAR